VFSTSPVLREVEESQVKGSIFSPTPPKAAYLLNGDLKRAHNSMLTEY
jgi:hypothetical protein